MNARKPLTLRINGEERGFFAAPGDTLLSALRDELQLTGAKRGCNQGACGACTVLLEGEPVRACLTLAHNCQDRPIMTIEGASAIAQRLQAAFIRAGAVQCGFCTPGMILSASALLAGNPNPGVEEIRDALSGNLCRCTGFRKIVEAVLLASESAAP